MGDDKKITLQVLNKTVKDEGHDKGHDSDPSSISAGGTKISELLQKAMLRMTGKFWKEATGTVDYKALRNSDEFRDYISLANQLEKVDLCSFNEAELLVFFINIYNSLTVHSICDIQKTSDIDTTLDVPNFWATYAYNIGGLVFALDDIEHGILRGNRTHPSTGKVVLEASDPRLKYSLKKVDPRIHFALNCGAKSCPVVRVYRCDNLEVALEAATKSYLSQEVQVDEKEGSVRIPQILQWYREDFADSQIGMLKWIEPYAEASVQKLLQPVILSGKKEEEEKDAASVIKYYYNWSLNKA